MTECPECGAVLQLKEMIQAEIFSCPECGTELEVASVEPFQAIPAPREAEDWGE